MEPAMSAPIQRLTGIGFLGAINAPSKAAVSQLAFVCDRSVSSRRDI